MACMHQWSRQAVQTATHPQPRVACMWTIRGLSQANLVITCGAWHGIQRVGGHTHLGNLCDVAHSRLAGDPVVHKDSHIRPFDQKPRARHEARGQGVLPKGPQVGETKE